MQFYQYTEAPAKISEREEYEENGQTELLEQDNEVVSGDIIRKRIKESKNKKEEKGDFWLNKLNEDHSNKLLNAMKSMVVKKVIEKEEYDIKFNFGR